MSPRLRRHAHHVSTSQYASQVDESVTAIGLLQEEYDTHSFRPTKASMIYKATGDHAAVTIGLLEYGQGGELPHPGFVMLGSPLLA